MALSFIGSAIYPIKFHISVSRIDDTVTAEHSNIILQMMQYISERVGGDCIRFREAAEDHLGVYVKITAGGGRDCPSSSCCSELGRTGNTPQILNLDPDACMHNSTVVHELVHTLGTISIIAVNLHISKKMI